MAKKVGKKEQQAQLRKDERDQVENELHQDASDKADRGEFAPDLDSKAMFKGLDEEKMKDVLNFLLSINLSGYDEYECIDTESSGLTGHEEKGYVRSDLILKFWKTNDKENAVTVVIEFQTTKDDDMAERLFIYTLNRSKTYVKDGVTYCEPARGITIYSTLDKPLQGTDIVRVRQYKYKEVGLFKFDMKNTDDFYEVEYPYINILALKQEHFNKIDNSALDIFRILFLYRYKKKPKLLLEKDLYDNIEKAHDIVAKYKGKVYEVLSAILIKLLQDIENILNFEKTENYEYGEVLDIMQNVKSYPKLELFYQFKADGIAEGEARGEAKGKAEGVAKGKMETALNSAKKMLGTQDVAYTTDFFEIPEEYVQALHDGCTVESILEGYITELFPDME